MIITFAYLIPRRGQDHWAASSDPDDDPNSSMAGTCRQALPVYTRSSRGRAVVAVGLWEL